MNSGIPITDLLTDEFRTRANGLFGFAGSERLARTLPGWCEQAKAELLIEFCVDVVKAYADSMARSDHGTGTTSQ